MADWDDAKLTALRQFWSEGVATKEIGRRLGVSKNAVVGKAHRLDLPLRPNPVGLTRAGKRALGYAVAATPLRSRLPASAPRTHGGKHEIIGPTLPPFPAPKEPPMIIPAVAQIPMPPPVVIQFPQPAALYRSCQWPTNDGPVGKWKFCDALDVVPGKPYCAEHCRQAYIQPGRLNAPRPSDNADTEILAEFGSAHTAGFNRPGPTAQRRIDGKMQRRGVADAAD